MAWAIYYDTGDRFSDADGPWADAPTEGVLLVVERIDDRLTFHSGHDFYQLEDDGTVVPRDERTILAAVGVIAMSPIKFGRYTSHTKMARVFARAKAEWR